MVTRPAVKCRGLPVQVDTADKHFELLLAKFKSRYTEKPVYGQIGAVPFVHAGRLEGDGQIVPLRQIDSRCIDFRYIQENRGI